MWPGNVNGPNLGADANYNYENGLQDDWDAQTHGTCLLNKIAGQPGVSQDWGVSKQASIIVVRLPPSITPPNTVRMSTVADALTDILQDVIVRGLQERAIINLAIDTTISLAGNPAQHAASVLQAPGGGAVDPTIAVFRTIYSTMARLMQLGVVITTSSGNLGWPTSFDVRVFDITFYQS